MIKIGIFGGKEARTTRDIINSFLSIANLRIKNIDTDKTPMEKNIALEKEIDVVVYLIESVKFIPIENFNILIINVDNNFEYISNLIEKQTVNDFLIINADNKDIYNYLTNNKSNLITCGFNSKSVITTSSIVDAEYKIIQVCIQRAFKTINKKTIDQQEFSVNISSKDNNLFSLLSSVTTVLLCDIKIESIS